MSINHGHVCSKSFLTRSHLWLFNYKQKISTSKRRRQPGSGSLCVCFESVLRQADGTHTLLLIPFWRLSACASVYIKSQLHNRSVLGDIDLPAVPTPGGLCRFSNSTNTDQLFFSICKYGLSILQTLFHLNSAEKKKAQ